jgi:hypothetical protein
MYRAANGTYKSAGTYDTHERAYEVAEEEERHARGLYHAVSPGTRQTYGYTARNHIVPYIGHLRKRGATARVQRRGLSRKPTLAEGG